MSSSIPQKIQTLRTTTDGKNIRDGTSLGDVLRIQDDNFPELKDHEALVEVRYVGIGPAEVTCLRAQRENTTPGFDVAGVVVKEKGGKFKEGERVFGMTYGGLGSTIVDESIRKRAQTQGAFSSYVIVCSDFLVKIPENVSFEQAAALPFSTLAAYQALSSNLKGWPAKVDDHRAILVVGGSSMLGLSIIQIAHHLGYKVFTTTSTNHFELVKKYGADQVYDFKQPGIEQQIRNQTSNSLTFAVDAINRGNSLSVAYKSIGNKGGEIITLIPRNANEMDVQRNDVGIKMRLPITLWGYDAEWDGMKFNPTSNEHSHAKAFLKDYGDWLQQKKIQTLPTQVVQERGLQGVLKGLEEVQRQHPSGVKLVACVRYQ